MSLVFFTLVIVTIFHLALPLTYYAYIWRVAKKYPWNLNIKNNYEPTITLIVATFNESATIIDKIENIAELNYPKNKLELIIVDSASIDETTHLAVNYFEEHNFPFKASVLREPERRGKSWALNQALKSAKGDVIATSDADCLWAPDALKKALVYLSDSSVAAVCGHEESTNSNQNISTRTEHLHRSFFNTIRIGESKIDSSIVFEGALALYKRVFLNKFDESCDDSGSALDLVQKGYRIITLPDVSFVNPFPTFWQIRSTKKIRRAQHLVEVWWRCFKLVIKRKNRLNPIITAANIFLYIFNPFLFLIFLFFAVFLLFAYPITILLVPLVLIFSSVRRSALLYLTNNFFLLIAIFQEIAGKKQIIWKK